MSDPGTSYRTRDEIQAMRKQRDPLARLAARLPPGARARLDEIDERVGRVVDEAAAAALADPEPPTSALMSDIY